MGFSCMINFQDSPIYYQTLAQIVNYEIVSTVSKWVDKIDINDNNCNELYLPYKFKLLLSNLLSSYSAHIHIILEYPSLKFIFTNLYNNKRILF